MPFYGLDISLKHFGLVELSDAGQVRNYWFMTDTKKFVDADPLHGLYYKPFTGIDAESEHFRRVRFVKKFLSCNLEPTHSQQPTHGLVGAFVAVEAYGFATMSPKFAEIAEQTGMIKNWMLESCASLRLHDPDSVKLFGAANGHALKKDMVLSIIGSNPSSEGDWSKALFFPQTLLKTVNKKIGVKKQQVVEEYDGPGTDLADAYWLAQLVRTEVLLRRGVLTLAQLSENQIRVFNRTTKAFPVNILDRPFSKYVEC